MNEFAFTGDDFDRPVEFLMEHRGYTGAASRGPGPGDESYFGRVLDIRDVVTFESGTFAGLLREFRDSVDDYIAACERFGLEPETPGERTQ